MLRLFTILLVASMAAAQAVAPPYDKSYKTVSIEFLPESEINFSEMYPLAAIASIKKEFASAEWDISGASSGITNLHREVPKEQYQCVENLPHLKAVAAVINKSIFDQNLVKLDKGYLTGSKPEEMPAIVAILKKSGEKVTIDTKTTKFISMQATKSAQTILPAYWFARIHREGLTVTALTQHMKVQGAHIMEKEISIKGKKVTVVSYTALFGKDEEFYRSDSYNVLLAKIKDLIGLTAAEETKGVN
jgi:hypothetical protein